MSPLPQRFLPAARLPCTECSSEQDKRGRYRGALASNKDYCNSACTLILAAGQKRQLEMSSTVGVQRLAPEKPPADDKILKASTAKKPGDDLHSDLGAYLDEMGISRELLATMDKVPAGGLKNLNFTELKALKLVTEPPFIARDATKRNVPGLASGRQLHQRSDDPYLIRTACPPMRPSGTGMSVLS